ncbi:gamma-glutamyltransferase [Nitrospirillum amazonense]|uniref:Glutathione hydrolase proenzyme n=1 Tax=Nitrospirillum amazonense TaxID=28077 RepID=A0A560JQT0_9PROT|nr:gamma-glutamyltransferase [Nitrospirillum amazonense]MDG3442010.1 gamma-glutamyltransferase [Nitrospirillum amazonense]TWB73493.1 gamma-glutamyltransferase 1 [Nitrospirillum amazonense]
MGSWQGGKGQGGKGRVGKGITRRWVNAMGAVALGVALFGGVALVQAKETATAPAALLSGGAVASADTFGTGAGAEILKAGGNAVDAAVATAFALAVTYPEAGNIGGGGFMTLFVDGKPYFIDYREVAPKAATRTMYLDAQGNVIPKLSLVGAKAAGVPGTVMGLWEAHHRFGTLPWERVIQPAITLAEKGFLPSDKIIAYRTDMMAQFAGTNFAQYFGKMEPGKIFTQPELAETLKRIAKDGPKEFYTGKTAQLLVTQMKKDGGLITAQDLADYKAKWREPIRFTWQGNVVYTAPPPSSGGEALAQLLKMKELRAADFKDVPLNSAKYIHLLAEIEKRVFADRAEYLGDPDFYKVPVEKLISDDYLAKRAGEVNPTAISPTPDVKPGLEPNETTHFSVVDKWGNAVSNTYTLNFEFGNGEVVSGAGFLMNDEMDDFSAKPGVPNGFGVVGKDANAIQPGKRMLSSMTPTIVTRDGKVSLVLGTPGGSRIFTGVFQVMSDVYDFHMPLQAAVAAQRVHHQLLPKDTIYYDPYAPLTGPEADKLKAMGYTLVNQGWNMGDVEAVRVIGTELETASDPRGRGAGQVVR